MQRHLSKRFKVGFRGRHFLGTRYQAVPNILKYWLVPAGTPVTMSTRGPLMPTLGGFKIKYRLELEMEENERLTESRVTMVWLLTKPRSFSDLPAFLDLNGIAYTV